MKAHGCRMNDESSISQMAETEPIINSRPLTTETHNNFKSQIPSASSNLFLRKTDVILPPVGVFDSPCLR